MTGCPATRNLCASRGVTPSTSSLRSGESPTTALSRLARCTTFETMERCPRSQTATLTRYSTRCLTTVERLVYNICHGMIESPRQLLLPPSIQAPSSFVSFTVYCTNSRTAAVSKRSTTPVKERKKTESATNVTHLSCLSVNLVPQVRFGGAIEKPMEMTIEYIKKTFKEITIPVTLVCAGNRRKEENMIKQGLG